MGHSTLNKYERGEECRFIQTAFILITMGTPMEAITIARPRSNFQLVDDAATLTISRAALACLEALICHNWARLLLWLCTADA